MSIPFTLRVLLGSMEKYCFTCIILYLRESSVHPFRGFLGHKNHVRIRIDGALDMHAKLETTISLSVGSL